jgi:hypothetical protein
MNDDGISPPMDDPGWGGAFDYPVCWSRIRFPDLLWFIR